MVTRRLGIFLSHWGVDATQYHWLLQASLKMDFRSTSTLTTGGQSNKTKSALLVNGAMNALFSLVISVSLVAGGANASFFSVVALGYAMVMAGMSILIEFGLVVISPDDFLILAHRPVSSRTFFAVKFSNLCFYILIQGAFLNLIPALVGVGCQASRWYFPSLYLAVSTFALLFVAGSIVALYGLVLRRVNYEKFKDLLIYVQIAFSFLFFFGYQVVPRVAGNIKGMDITVLAHSWAVAFPSVWFAGVIELALAHATWEALGLALIALLMMAVVLPVLFRNVSLDYSAQIGRMMSSSTKRADTATAQRATGLLPRLFKRLLLSNVEERAFFYFILTMLRRNRQLKLQVYPNFGIVIAMLAVAFLQKGELADPLTERTSWITTIIPVMSFLMAGSAIAGLLPFSDEYQGGWIFHVAPVAQRERILKAVKKAVVLVLFVPLFLLNVVVFSFFWPVSHALGLGFCGFAFGLLGLQVMLFRFQDFPFSRKLEKGKQTMRLALVFMMFGMFGLMSLLASLFASGWVWFLSVLGVLLVLSIVLGHVNNRLYASRKSLQED
ncbi:MAG TPA: hypothetical protein VK639_09905 [Terriglobales bacterium]|nr:hypothetical protein [Terriglobales bacterium]